MSPVIFFADKVDFIRRLKVNGVLEKGKRDLLQWISKFLSKSGYISALPDIHFENNIMTV